MARCVQRNTRGTPFSSAGSQWSADDTDEVRLSAELVLPSASHRQTSQNMKERQHAACEEAQRPPAWENPPVVAHGCMYSLHLICCILWLDHSIRAGLAPSKLHRVGVVIQLIHEGRQGRRTCRAQAAVRLLCNEVTMVCAPQASATRMSSMCTASSGGSIGACSNTMSRRTLSSYSSGDTGPSIVRPQSAQSLHVRWQTRR